MQLPVSIRPKYLNPGSSNAEEQHCMSLTYFHGQQIIAYGSVHLVVIASTSLNVISALDGHASDSLVTAVAWAPYSGKLSSASTKLDIIIWEPKEEGVWVKSQTIKLPFIGYCMAWSICDFMFCVTGDYFQIYQREQRMHNNQTYKVSFMDPTKYSFCSYSKDSRFIMTLYSNSKEVLIWHKRGGRHETGYRRIPLKHPSPVLNIRWRNSNNVHERCSFMSLATDHVVRIWSETGVNETLAFNVVAAIPSPDDSFNVAAAFLSTSSRIISNSTTSSADKNVSVDTYAYGHGHMPSSDKNNREANIVSHQELNRNMSWLITYDSKRTIYIWEI